MRHPPSEIRLIHGDPNAQAALKAKLLEWAEGAGWELEEHNNLSLWSASEELIMIKLLYVKYLHNFQFELGFSDGAHGVFDLSDYLKEHQGPLLEPLKDEAYAKRCFIDAGALCWPNGLELSPARLHEPQYLKRVA